jgi:ABC-2 type transport system ATP-binding protein
MSDTKPIISVKEVSKIFTYHNKAEGLKGSLKALVHREKLTKEAVKHVSFDIQPGEFVGFIGKNGAGKTTTLKMLSGILTPSAGEIVVDGHTPIHRENAFKKKISIVMGQKFQLWMTLPAIESFSLIQRLYDIPERTYRKRIKDFSELMEIEDILNVQVRKLSLGQRMKCELLASLLHNPKVLFLDEPTIGLDVLSQKNIRTFLREHNKKEGTTIILTSHNMDDVENLCKRLIIIDEGEVGYDGTLKDVIAEHSDHKFLKVQFVNKITKKELAEYGRVIESTGYEAALRVPSDHAPKIIKDLVTKHKVKDISITDVTLEEIVEKLFQK